MTSLTAPLFSIRARGPLGRALTYQRRAGSPHVARQRTSFPPLPPQFITQQSHYATEKLHWLRPPFTSADRDAWSRSARALPFPATSFNAAMHFFLTLAFSELFHSDMWGLLTAPFFPGWLLASVHASPHAAFGGTITYGTDPRRLTLFAPHSSVSGDTITFVLTGLQPGRYYIQIFSGSHLFPFGATGIYIAHVN